MKNLYYLAFPFFFSLVLFACGQKADKELVAPSHVLDEMDPKKARVAIAEWDSLRTSFIGTLDSMGQAGDSIYVVKGFHVPFDDIRQLMDNIGNKEQLFAMLAIEKDRAGNPHLALIFQAPDTSKAQTIRFYDFTKPCPNNCPD
jgi:hypothetical protein